MADLLDTWRKNIDFGTLTWRAEPPARVDQRQQKQRKRSRRDRKVFGDDVWGVSQKHREAKTREELLRHNGLPAIRSELELAKWLGISLGRLRYFTHDNPADSTWHYVRYTIPKRTGGQRVILAPKTELKAIQRKILRDLLDKLKPHGAAHGFVADHSILSNARPHVGKKVVLRIDLKDFFPTVTYPRVRGLFILWGYGFSVASTLALLCTEYDRVPFERDGQKYWISTGPRALVQGAPTSPALANFTVWGLDCALQRLSTTRRFTYTRYADDLTFSGDSLETALFILGEAQKIIGREGFVPNPDKTRIMRRSSRQSVTRLVVNDKVNISRTVRRQIRAILHNAEQTGLEAQNREGRADFRAYLQGMIGFVAQANPGEAAKLSQRLHQVV